MVVCKEEVPPVQERSSSLEEPEPPHIKEEVSPEQERSSSLLQEEPEPPHIKEEQEEILQRPEEPDGSTSTLPAVESEDDDEDISSHCSEVEVELESDTEVTEDSNDWEETSGGQSVLNTGTGLACVRERNFGVGIKEVDEKYN